MPASTGATPATRMTILSARVPGSPSERQSAPKLVRTCVANALVSGRRRGSAADSGRGVAERTTATASQTTHSPAKTAGARPRSTRSHPAKAK